MLAVDLSLSGAQALSAGAYVNASEDPTRDQHEMTLDVNPSNPLNLAGFSISSDGADRAVDVFYTRDGGLTWDTTRIGSSEDGRMTAFRFDPSIAFDADGNLFVAYGAIRGPGAPMSELIVARSQDGGETFDLFTQVDISPWDPFAPLGLDKWHLATGPSGPNNAGQAVYVTYTVQSDSPDALSVYVAGSNDAGATFTMPKLVSDGTSVSDFYADPAVGPNGELYIAWWDVFGGELKFDRDLNGLWVEDDPADEFGTDATILSLSSSVSGVKVPAQPERGINTAPVLDVDRSGGPNDGRLYLTYVDIATGQTHPNYDIYLVTSDDMGASWSSSATGALQGNVEDSTGTEFNPWVDVDQTTGSVNLIYYTTDGDQQAGNKRVNARLAASIDGGNTFVYTDLSAFTSDETGGSGSDYLEYIGLAVHDGTAHGIWSSRVDPVDADLEALWASAATTSASNVLTVTGEDVAAQNGTFNDFFTIKLSDVRSDYLEVWWYDPVLMTNTLKFAGKIGSIGRIDIDGGDGTNIITIDPGVVAEIGVANITIVNANAPRVVNVLFSRDEGGASIPPELTVDMAVEVFGQGINQLVSIQQGGVNQIEIEFDMPIDSGSINLDSLDLIPLRKLGNRPEPTGFSVAADNLSAAWDFDYLPSNPGIPSDQYALRLHDTVLGAEGRQLDGEWTNPISTTDTSGWSFANQPSGDGIQGGDFDFYFTLLGADFNTDNIVDLLDLDVLGAHFGFNPADFNDGDANGDGSVDLLDLDILGTQFGFDWRDLGLLALTNADFDGNNQFDFDDTDDFVVAFSQELDEADLNGDGSWDQIDLDIFGIFLSFGV